jgi:signal peptidase I
MEPTLPEGSRSIVDKFTYRWKDPAVGDIILFTAPDNSHFDFTSPAEKRVIAVGGETVWIRDGVVYVDGKEREPLKRSHRQEHPGSGPPTGFFDPDNPYLAYGVNELYKVPQGHYFVMGDNRRDSIDSRCYGAIPKERIIGRVVKILWPPRRLGIAK